MEEYKSVVDTFASKKKAGLTHVSQSDKKEASKAQLQYRKCNSQINDMKVTISQSTRASNALLGKAKATAVKIRNMLSELGDAVQLDEKMGAKLQTIDSIVESDGTEIVS